MKKTTSKKPVSKKKVEPKENNDHVHGIDCLPEELKDLARKGIIKIVGIDSPETPNERAGKHLIDELETAMYARRQSYIADIKRKQQMKSVSKGLYSLFSLAAKVVFFGAPFFLAFKGRFDLALTYVGAAFLTIFVIAIASVKEESKGNN